MAKFFYHGEKIFPNFLTEIFLIEQFPKRFSVKLIEKNRPKNRSTNFRSNFFDFFGRIVFDQFYEKIFSKASLAMKINSFCTVFFYWQGMYGYYRFRTSIRLALAHGKFVPKKTVQILWICTYRDLFASGFIL